MASGSRGSLARWTSLSRGILRGFSHRRTQQAPHKFPRDDIQCCHAVRYDVRPYMVLVKSI